MKAFLLSCISIFALLNTNGQLIKGPASGGGFSNGTLAGSNKSWFSVESVDLSDDLYTEFGNLDAVTNSYTDYIHVNKFMLDVPPGSVIEGIQISIERSDPDQNTAEYSVRILKYDMITGDEKSDGEAFPAIDDTKTYGGPTDLWGEFWTEDMINDNGFGIAIAAQRIDGSSGNTGGRIDNINVTVFYAPPTTLPVSLMNFSVKKNNGSIDINWTTDDESGLSYYEVQRSADGRNFSSIQSVQSKNNASKTDYASIDNKPLNGISYYRLKMVEVDGSATYSKIATVQFATGNLVTIYPTLWKKGTNLNISNPNNERLVAYFFNSSGQYVGISATNNSVLSTSILSNLKGIIYYKIINADGQSLGKGNIVVN